MDSIKESYQFHKDKALYVLFQNRKKLLYLKNWRPISLLNVDYKIASKALAFRLKKVISTIINNTQTGYLKGRFIGENIRLITDIEVVALFIDFEEAFDSLEWEYLFKALDTLFILDPILKPGLKPYTQIFLVV